MTKQEQEQIEVIHKMAQIALGKQITLSCTEYAIKEGFFDNFITLYNAGYRKIPEDAVVLLVGEYNQPLDEKTIEYFVNHNQEIRKETAKEILILLGKGFDETKITEFKNLPWYKLFCRELKQRYGVEVEG